MKKNFVNSDGSFNWSNILITFSVFFLDSTGALKFDSIGVFNFKDSKEGELLMFYLHISSFYVFHLQRLPR
jgi:hypothetical protein